MTETSSTLILADDHPVVLGGLKALLQIQPGFRILAACSNGIEALNLVRELDPDIAVLDINMPGLTGIEVLLRIEEEGLRTRAVFLTASATDKQLLTAVEHGAWGVMLKETAADGLVECLDGVTRGKRWLPPELVTPATQRETERRKEVAHLESAVTNRERELMGLVAEGLSNKHIARRLNISEGTVKIHLHNAYQKLGVSNRTALAVIAQSFLRSQN